MNIRNLEYFLAVAEDMNITRAARRLFISQQALSSRISMLEEELGVKLFERTPRLSLTAAGECVRSAALEMTGTHKMLMQELNDLQSSCVGPLRIGISFFHSLYLMPKVLPDYCREHPLVEVTLLESTAAAMEDNLDSGGIDLMVTLTPIHHESFETVEIGCEKLCICVPRHVMDSKYGGSADEMCGKFASGVSLCEFFSEPMIMYDQREHLHMMLESFYAGHGEKMRILMRTRNLHTAYALSREGLGITVFPEYFLKSRFFAGRQPPDVYVFPLTDPGLTASLVTAYNRRRYLSRAAREMIEAIRRAV